MSECVFPTYFKNSSTIYDLIGNANSGSHSKLSGLSELTKIVEETCLSEHYDYLLYYSLLPHFYARYHAMKTYGCCRQQQEDSKNYYKILKYRGNPLQSKTLEFYVRYPNHVKETWESWDTLKFTNADILREYLTTVHLTKNLKDLDK